MAVWALGINHTTAPLDLRGRFAFAIDQIAPTLQGLRQSLGGATRHPQVETAILSTCNRTEIYCAGQQPALDHTLDWLAHSGGVSPSLLRSHSYTLEESLVARHAFRVASGLDSMVLGEAQILGQMKDAVRAAETAGALGTTLNQLFQRSFAVAKEVRTSTEIGAHSISMAAAAVRLAGQLFEDLTEIRILFVGAGEMIELAATHFAAKNPKSLAIANRTLERGEKLASRFGGEVMRLADLPDRLHEFDAVVSCTASSLPIIGLGAVERALKKRRHRPMFMVDLAVPRDIEPEVKALEDIYLYTVDDLASVVQTAQASRQAAVAQAEPPSSMRACRASCTGWTSAAPWAAWCRSSSRSTPRPTNGARWRSHAPRSSSPGARTWMPCWKRSRAASRRRCCTAPWPSCARAMPTRAPRRPRPSPACSCARSPGAACSGARRPAARPLLPSPASRIRARMPRLRTTAAATLLPLPTMKPFLRSQLERYAQRLEELDFLLSREDIMSDMAQYRTISREHAEVTQVAGRYTRYRQREADLAGAREMLDDPDMADMAREEIAAAEAELVQLEDELQRLLLPRDPDEARNAFLEIRAGTGGDESALFAGDLARMYTRYAATAGWKVEILSASDNEIGGYKGSGAARGRRRRLWRAALRIRRPPRAARARHRDPGPHPYQRLHRGRDARAR